MPVLYSLGYRMSSPLVFLAFTVVFRVPPPNEVLPVNPDARQTALGDEPVDVGAGDASQGGCGADADVFIWVYLLCHAPTVADRIPLGNRRQIVGLASFRRIGRRLIGRRVDLFDGTAGEQLRQDCFRCRELCKL